MMNLKYYDTMHIMEAMEQLENTGVEFSSLESYMVNRIAFDWDSNPIWCELYEVLKATMMYHSQLGWISK